VRLFFLPVKEQAAAGTEIAVNVAATRRNTCRQEIREEIV